MAQFSLGRYLMIFGPPPSIPSLVGPNCRDPNSQTPWWKYWCMWICDDRHFPPPPPPPQSSSSSFLLYCNLFPFSFFSSFFFQIFLKVNNHNFHLRKYYIHTYIKLIHWIKKDNQDFVPYFLAVLSTNLLKVTKVEIII